MHSEEKYPRYRLGLHNAWPDGTTLTVKDDAWRRLLYQTRLMARLCLNDAEDAPGRKVRKGERWREGNDTQGASRRWENDMLGKGLCLGS